MSNDPVPWARRPLRYPCPRCDAPEGEWCVTASGRRADTLHMARFHRAFDALYKEGNE